MSKLEKQYCTELYPTADEENFGRVGDFCVYEADPVDRLITEALGLARMIKERVESEHEDRPLSWEYLPSWQAAKRFIEEHGMPTLDTDLNPHPGTFQANEDLPGNY